MAFILQLPHPIPGSKWYPIQERELEEFALENEIPYFQHWYAWPQPLNEYITPDNDAPNEKGHRSWENFIKGILISTP